MSKRHATLKNPFEERALFRRRVLFMIFVVFILVFVLIGRLINLQIFHHQTYTTLAKENQLNLFPVAPNRGLIYDRYGLLIAENTPVFDLTVTPNLVVNMAKTLHDVLT